MSSENNISSFPNNDGEATNTNQQGDSSAKRLKSFIERIERLEEEKAVVSEDVREVYGEAKSAGFDPKIMRKVIRLRKMEQEKRREEEELIEVYKDAVGLD